MSMVPESVRSQAWAIAKPVALAEWQKGSADTTQMLVACSRAVDAVLEWMMGNQPIPVGSGGE